MQSGLRRAFLAGICMLVLTAAAWFPMGPALADEDPANKTVEEILRDKGKESTPAENGIGAETPPPPPGSSQGLGELVARTVLALGLIFLFIYGLVRFLAHRQRQAGANLPMQVRAGIYLGHNKSLKLVKVGRNYYLLGVGENIHLIREFSSPEEREELEEFFDSQPGAFQPGATFDINRFRKFVREKWRGKPEGTKPEGNFQLQLEERLEEIRQKRKMFLGDAGGNTSEEGKGDDPAQ